LVIGEEEEDNGARAFLPVSFFMEFLTAKAQSTPRKSFFVGR
jgi:hypothetical protein